MNGWIKLHRKITKWEWYDDGNTFRVFLHLLLTANHEDSRYRGHKIPRGSVVTGRKTLAEHLRLSEQQVRTSLKKLNSTNEITSQSTNEFTIITICNYETYQDKNLANNQRNNQQITNNQPTDNQQITTSEEEKKRRREERKKYYVSGKAFDASTYISSLISEIRVEEESDHSKLLTLHIWQDFSDNTSQADQHIADKARWGAWYDPVRKLINNDGYSAELVWKVWKQARRDEFWSKNILSTSKLREKFPQLLKKFNLDKDKSHEQFIDSLFEQ